MPTIKRRIYECSQCGYRVEQKTNHRGKTYSVGAVNVCPKCPPYKKYPEYGGMTEWLYVKDSDIPISVWEVVLWIRKQDAIGASWTKVYEVGADSKKEAIRNACIEAQREGLELMGYQSAQVIRGAK